MRKIGDIGAALVALAIIVMSDSAFGQRGSQYSHDTHVAQIIRSAHRGSEINQTQLGYLYETGQGVPQDYQLAAVWYSRAARQGHARAQYLLGMLFDKGKGVPIDYVEALRWLNLAASRANNTDRDYFVRIRNAIASKLSMFELYEAQRRAREWFPVPER